MSVTQTVIIKNFHKISTNSVYQCKTIRVKPLLKIISAKNFYKWVYLEIKDQLKSVDYKVNLYFTFYFLKYNYDSSNCSIMGKIIEDDVLVLNKIIKDDKKKYVGWFCCRSEDSDRDYEYVELVIEKYRNII